MTTAAVNPAKVQPSNGLRALAQGKALPISNDPIGVCCGAATTARGMKQRRRRLEPGRALGDLRPPGKGPGCRSTEAWVRYPLAASTLWKGASGRRRQASGDAKGRERGSPPNPWREVSASNKYSVLST